MDKNLDFRFQIPQPPSGPLFELSEQEAEQMLVKRLDEAGADNPQALWDLAQFYKLNKRHDQAIERLRQLIQLLPDPEEKASCVFTMGQTEEQVGDYAAAIGYYKEALVLEPASTFTWYFIHNNLGYSLNALGRYAEGEGYCRTAIRIDAARSNGHKNLGIALAGQGEYRGAAKAYVAATQANAADQRSFRLLEDLLKQHPELEYEFQDAVDCCRKAIEFTAGKVAELKPVVHRGWRKHLLMLKWKIQSLFHRQAQ
jgi:tetratricopeptide (TPR) repeat protein